MEKAHGGDNKLVILVYEFLGTFILSLSFCLLWSYDAHSTQFFNLALTAGTGYYTAHQICGPITGGHFNPAISVAVFIGMAASGGNFVLLFGIIIAQCAGSLVGMLATRGFRVEYPLGELPEGQLYPVYPSYVSFSAPAEI